MGWFDAGLWARMRQIWAERRTNELPFPGAHRVMPHRVMPAGRTAAGVYVSPDRALRSATVWACHRYLSQTVGQLPVRVMRFNPQTKSPERVEAHPTDYVLVSRPNPEMGAFQFKETLTGWAVLWGNGYAEIERDAVGRVANLWPIHPERVRPMRDEAGKLFYRVHNGTSGPATDLAATDMFHLRGFGDGPVGLSVIDYAAQTIGWAQATELFSAAFIGEGMHFGGSVSFPGKADPEAIERMRVELENIHKGPRRVGKWFFGDAGATVTPLTATPRDAQFIATMQHQVEEICRFFGVPPQKVQHMLRMTFNNVEQLAIEVVVDSITPWCVRFEEEATYKLFGQNRANLYVKLELKGLLRGDFVTRQNGLQVMRRNGVINADYWCDLEELPRIGEGGDKHIVEGNMVDLTMIGGPPNASTTPPAPPISPATGYRASADLAELLATVDSFAEGERVAA